MEDGNNNEVAPAKSKWSLRNLFRRNPKPADQQAGATIQTKAKIPQPDWLQKQQAEFGGRASIGNLSESIRNGPVPTSPGSPPDPRPNLVGMSQDNRTPDNPPLPDTSGNRRQS